MVRGAPIRFSLRKTYIYGMVLVVAAVGLTAPASALAVPFSAATCPSLTPIAVTQNPQSINSGVEVLFDPERNYRLEQVTGTGLCGQFKPIPGTPNFGFEHRGIWLRFRLPPLGGDPRSWRLLVPNMETDHFCVHWPVRPSGYQSQCGDIRDPLGSGPRNIQGWYFAVPEMLDSSHPVLLYTHGERAVQAPLELGTADAFVQKQNVKQTWLGAFYGTLFGAMLFGLVLFVTQQDRTHLYFSAYITAFALYVATYENDLGGLGLTGWAVARLNFPIGWLTLAIGTAFHQRFLEIRTHAPLLHWLLWGAVGLMFVPTIVLLPFFPTVSVLLITCITTLWLFPLLTAIIVRIYQGSRLALYPLMAWVILGASSILRILEFLGLQVMYVQTAKVLFYVGLLLFPGFLLIGLIDRLRLLAQERDRANKLALSNEKLALHRAHYDEFTRLPNRTKLREDLHERITGGTGVRRLALVTLGLDRFSAINDALGYKIGDSVLHEIANRLQHALPGNALLARTGPDLFTWAVDVPGGEEGSVQLQDRYDHLLKALSAPLQLGSGANVTASAGMALYPDHADSAEQLLQRSDIALHHAKRRGGGTLQLFEPAMHQTASRYMALNSDLHRAVQENRLELHYQPIVALSSGAPTGVEALARWRREDGQYVPPDQFIPVAETSNLLQPFTEWVIDTACRQIADWRARGIRMPHLSFNLSAAQLRIARIDEYLLKQLRDTGVPGSALTVEVTEGALLENITATQVMLARLRLQGLSVAVDDFGVGYASPHYLRVLPVNILKIDGSFLQEVPQNPEATSLLNGMIDIGRSLKLRIVVEGVESQEQAEHLTRRGVSAGQGYWFSRALPAAELEEWLKKQTTRTAA